MWQQGLVLKLSRLDCSPAYLIWIVRYFTERKLKVEYEGILTEEVAVERGAPQGSCLGPVAYITNHHDLPQIFSNPSEVHAYVDDVAIVYTPAMQLNHKRQIEEVQNRINKDMVNLSRYSINWSQPLQPEKSEAVVYHTSVQCPRIDIRYEGKRIEQKRSVRYLGFHLDAKLSFRLMIDSQLIKLRKGYDIMKWIHRQFPASIRLKNRFFNTYLWPHLNMMATIYFLFSNTAQNRVAAFYRRCQRLINCLFECPTEEMHEHFLIPTLEQRFRRSLTKRLQSIQLFETAFIECVMNWKTLRNALHGHYRSKEYISRMPVGRPNKKIVALLLNKRATYWDQLAEFTST
jgi:hypothetical protein